MADLATALAAEGMTTVTLDFCNTRLWDGRHLRNGLDLIRVADALNAERVVYVGFSAGGLAAVIAGRNDQRTLGVVTLDLVDTQQIGESAAAAFAPPLIGLVGDPSPCNAQNNGLAVFAAAPDATVTWVDGAEHCDFESPTDWLCRLLCQRNDSIEHAPRPDIIAAAVHSVMGLVGLESEIIDAAANPSGRAQDACPAIDDQCLPNHAG
ncbi:alpha/beta hydrolase [Thiocapsa imhoffii]|uniref:alpha/beta hydrolase n=1 Tax=Thiocapsa imhoffii TaxID=382777 RepID=UPI001908248E|nr:alpha/beta hydrolase [Thiocapsa imhoffii]